MFDNTFSAAAEWDGPDTAGLMMRDLSTGMWVEYDPWWSPEDVDVVPLEVLLHDDPGEPGLDELDDWDAPVLPLDELPPVDTDDGDTADTDTDEGASENAGDRDGDDTRSAAGHAAGHHDNTDADTDTETDTDEGASDSGADAGGPVPVPAGLTSMPPGPDLGAALADIPVRRVSGYDTVDVMAAAYRQASHARAVFLKALLETGMRQSGSVDTVSRVACPGEFAAEEARTALVWSRRRADGTFEFAWDIHERLPVLGQAMYDGVLDEPRARAFVQWTTGLTDDQAAHIITTLLPQAAGMPVGALVDRIKRMAIAIDPAWAQRRYRAAVKGRRVEGSRNDDGTANIAGLDLPVDRAAAACDRIDVLARACKHAGDSRPVDHIRTDLYLGMLDGTFEHLDEDQIIAHVLTHPFTDETDGDGPSDGGGDGDDGGPGTRPNGDDGPSGTGPTGDGGGPDDGGTGGGDDSDSEGGEPGAGDGGGSGSAGRDGGPSGRDGDTGPGGTGPGDGPACPHDGHGGSPSGGERHDGGSDIDGDGTVPTGRHDGGGSDPADDHQPGPPTDHGHADGAEPDDGGGDADHRDGDGGPDHHADCTGSGDRDADGTDSVVAAHSGGEASRGRTGDDPQVASRGPGTTAPATRTSRPTTAGSAACGPDPPDPDGSRSQPAGSQPAGSRSAGSGSAGWSVRELRVEVAALLGLNEHPAEIVGWDFIPAALARTVIGSMRGGQWRWVICDQHGRPIDSGITRKRPRPPTGTAGGTVPRGTGPPAGRRAGIVELQIRADELPNLAAVAGEGPHAAWAAVIADIATQHHATITDETDAAGADGDGTDGVDVTDDAAGEGDGPDAVDGTDTAAVTGVTDTPSEDDAATMAMRAATMAMREARRRTARAGLRRWVQIRDRQCTHPACRVPATRTDQDHAEDHADGGPTTGANLGSACRHDHRLRHDGGWRIWKPTPDTTAWRSPLGHTYTNRPPPVMPTLPKPWPAADATPGTPGAPRADADPPEQKRDHGRREPGCCPAAPTMPPVAAPRPEPGQITTTDIPPF